MAKCNPELVRQFLRANGWFISSQDRRSTEWLADPMQSELMDPKSRVRADRVIQTLPDAGWAILTDKLRDVASGYGIKSLRQAYKQHSIKKG